MAGRESIKLLVITPQRQVLDEAVDAVVIPAHDGELGILLDRAPLMCELGIGQLRYTRQNDTRRMFIDRGFAQVLGNRVIVLTNRAVPAEQITPEMVAAAETEAEQQTGTSPAARAASDQARERVAVLRRIRSGA